jgi:carbamoyl-phosphate synthase large subunit
MGIHTFLPTEKQFEERHKVNLPGFGKKYNIRVPFSKAIFSVAEIPGLVHEFTYPMVVKGKYYDASVAHTSDQVYTYFNKISSKWGLPIIIQQYINGTEYNATGLGDGKGNTVSIEEIFEMTRHFVKSTKWRGGFELELMKGQDDQFYLLEINPRMPAWIYLSVGVGQNIPEALVKLAMGEKVKPYTKFRAGKMFVRYAWDLIVDVEEFHQISTTGEL